MSRSGVRRFPGLPVASVLAGALLFFATYVSVYGPELGDNEVTSCLGRPFPTDAIGEGPTNAFHTNWPLGTTCGYGDLFVPEPDWAPTYFAIASGVMVVGGLGLGIFGALRREPSA